MNFKSVIKYLFALNVLVSCFTVSVGQVSIHKEAEDAKLTGTVEIVKCSNSSGGKMVKGLDNSEANAILIESINIPEQGEYYIAVSYFAVNDRNLSYKMNGGAANSIAVPASGSWCYQAGYPKDIKFSETFQ